MRTVRAIDIDTHGSIWAATSGGVFVYSGDSTQTKEYRNINALQSLDLRTLLCIKNGPESIQGQVVVGASDGSLDILDQNESWTNIADIKRATQYAKRGVTGLLQHGSTLYITTEFGLVTFDLTRQLFIETIDRIGSLQEKTPVNGLAIFRDSLWLATDSGLAVTSLQQPSLRPPSVWTVIRGGAGLPTRPITNIAANSSDVYCAADTIVYSVNAGVVTPIDTSFFTILDMTISNDVLYWSDLNDISTLNGRLGVSWNIDLLGHSSVFRNGKVELLAFLSSVGVGVWDFDSLHIIGLNSPVSNKFARMVIDTKGALWVATDIEPPRSGEGVNYFDGVNWTGINKRSYPDLLTNSCYRISALDSGTVLVGTWGRGGTLIRMVDGSPQITSLTPSNSAVQGIASDSTYSLIADGAVDTYGTLWMINEQAAAQLFVAVHSDGTTSGFQNCIDARSNTYREIAIDLANNKWAGSTVGAGLVVWNDRKTDDRSDDICNVVRTSNTQIPDNTINALAVDLAGALWIGTPRGLAVISYPTGATNTNVPYVRRITQLASPIVNDIFVDALNYKWIATSTGVFVLNEDGTEVLAEITRTTAPLLDDNIRSVVVDSRSGTAYFGTSVGCTTVKTSSIEPTETYDLSIYPQPFKLSEHNQVVIDGLAADSDVRVLTVSGTFVQAMQVRGRQTSWDGYDYNGRQVPPGVYILQVSSASSKQSGVAKIAVQR